jgi:hypothetical protein
MELTLVLVPWMLVPAVTTLLAAVAVVWLGNWDELGSGGLEFVICAWFLATAPALTVAWLK